jgi:uncharacterized membrane protein YphA (DoxX/SURF4 family)
MTAKHPPSVEDRRTEIAGAAVPRPNPAPTERRGAQASFVSLVLGILFLGTGISKLVGPDFLVETFQGWGFAPWFMRTIGIVEILGAVLVLIPAVCAVGALVLGAVMVAAFGTHLVAGQFLLALLPVGVILLCALLLWPPRSSEVVARPHPVAEGGGRAGSFEVERDAAGRARPPRSGASASSVTSE